MRTATKRLICARSASVVVTLAVVTSLVGCGDQNANEHEIGSPADESGLPESQAMEDMVSCMRDRGWDAYRDELGFPAIDDTPPEQRDIMMDDFRACRETTGLAKIRNKDSISTEQLQELYTQEVRNHECMLALGLESNEPPTLQVYLDTYGTAEHYDSSVPGLTAQLGRDMYTETVLACPPPSWFMNLPSH